MIGSTRLLARSSSSCFTRFDSPSLDRFESWYPSQLIDSAIVREPEESFYFDKGILGNPMSRTEALASSLIKEFFAVADFVAFNDPAVKVRLRDQQVSSEGRNGFA